MKYEYLNLMNVMNVMLILLNGTDTYITVSL